MAGSMDGEAFIVLEAISRGDRAEGPDTQRWIEAFKTIRWVVDSQDGPKLTAEGRRAREQMAMERRAKAAASKMQPARPAPARRAALG